MKTWMWVVLAVCVGGVIGWVVVYFQQFAGYAMSKTDEEELNKQREMVMRSFQEDGAQYQNTCTNCGGLFYGSRHRVTCKRCQRGGLNPEATTGSC